MESPLPDSVKRAIVANSEADTLYSSKFDGIHARVMRTPTSQAAMDKYVSNPFEALWGALQTASTSVPLYQVVLAVLADPQQRGKLLMLSQ